MIYECVSGLIDDFIDDEVLVSLIGKVTGWMMILKGLLSMIG
jgi:hypothetical protein